MDFRMREALRKSRVFLVKHMIFGELLDYIIAEDIFSDTMLDYIKAGNEQTEKIRRMLDYLSKRPASCYDRFLSALTNSGQEHCAQHIRENYIWSGPTQTSSPSHEEGKLPSWETKSFVAPKVNTNPVEDYDVPMSNPGAEDIDKISLLIPNISISEQSFHTYNTGFAEVSNTNNRFGSIPVQESSALICLNQSNPFQILHLSPGSPVTDHILSNVYKMDSEPRGLALIINNEQFSSMECRQGSRKDMETLHDMFKFLGFRVSHEKDKTAAEMRALLHYFAVFPGITNADAITVVILSHGGQGGIIFGRDGCHDKNGHSINFITDDEIRDIFSARNCPLMMRKPKLIIIQACRGRNEDRPSFLPHYPQHVGTDRVMHDGSMSMSSTGSTFSSRTANMADMCLIHSTVQGFVSYRHPIDGSPFVQTLAQVFREKARHEHLMDMMAEVNQKLSSYPLQDDLRTIPSTTNTLTKKWYFNPPPPPLSP